MELERLFRHMHKYTVNIVVIWF